MINFFRLFFIALAIIFFAIIAAIAAIIDRDFNLYCKVYKPFSNSVFKIAGIKLKVSGIENIEPDKEYVFVSNHASQFDIPVVFFSIPVKMILFYKKELNKIPLFGWQLYISPQIEIDRRNVDSARKSIERAKWLMSEKNMSILLFAEGTRSETGEIQPFKRGAFNLAAKVAAPVIPVTISGSYPIMSKGKLKINPGTIKIHFDKPVSTENVKTRQDEINLMNSVREIMLNNHSMVV